VIGLRDISASREGTQVDLDDSFRDEEETCPPDIPLGS